MLSHWQPWARKLFKDRLQIPDFTSWSQGNWYIIKPWVHQDRHVRFWALGIWLPPTEVIQVYSSVTKVTLGKECNRQNSNTGRAPSVHHTTSHVDNIGFCLFFWRLSVSKPNWSTFPLPADTIPPALFLLQEETTVFHDLCFRSKVMTFFLPLWTI